DKVDQNRGLKYVLNGKLVSDIVIDTSAAATDSIDYLASGRSVPSQLDQVLPRFSVQKSGPYHPFGRIRIAPFGKGVLRILGESAYIIPNGIFTEIACKVHLVFWDPKKSDPIDMRGSGALTNDV